MATYYFNASGNDSTGDGSIGTPWKTISKFNTESLAGTFDGNHSVLFNGGDAFNDERMLINHSGTGSGTECTIGSYGTGKADFTYNGGAIPDGQTIEIIAGKSHLIIEDLDIDNTAPNENTRTINTNGSHTNINVKRCEINNANFGVYYRGVTTGLVEDCTVFSGSRHGIAIWASPSVSPQCSGITVDGNTVTGANDGIVFHASGTEIDSLHLGNTHVCSNNTVEGSFTENCIDLATMATGFTVEFNICSGNRGGMVNIDHGASDVIFRGNILRNTDNNSSNQFLFVGTSGTYEPASNIDVHSNLLYGTSNAQQTDGINMSFSLDDLRINNNMLDFADTSATTASACLRTHSSGSSPTDVEVKNNIVYAKSNVEYWRFGAPFAPDNGQFDIDYNIYYGHSDSGFRHQTNYYSLAQWQTAFSQDANSSETDPGFVTRGSDYSITGTSAAYRAGVLLYGQAGYTDFNGNDFSDAAFHATTPSVGAYEVASGGDVTAPTQPGTPGTFTSITASSYDFTWTASTDAVGVTGYDIYRDAVLVDTSNTNSYSATGLASNTTYAWTVKAYDLAGNRSALSGEGSQITSSPSDTTDPTFSGVTTAVKDSGGLVTLSWTQGTDNVTAQGDIVYEIYLSTTSGHYNYSVPYYTTAGGVASQVLDFSNKRGTYYFVVRAKDSTGNTDNNTTEVSITLSTLTEFSAKLG